MNCHFSCGLVDRCGLSGMSGVGDWSGQGGQGGQDGQAGQGGQGGQGGRGGLVWVCCGPVMICSVHLHGFRFLLWVNQIESTLRGALGPKKTS